MPPTPVCPGNGAPFAPPPSTLVGAVGRLIWVVVEDALWVLFPAGVVLLLAVPLPVGCGAGERIWVVVKTKVLVEVLACLSGPIVGKVEITVEVMMVWFGCG